MNHRALIATLVLSLVAAGGCSKSSADTVAVVGTDTSCTAAKRTIAAGETTFEFENKANDVNELYVLRPNGDIVGEVENVTSGSRRTLNADLVAGTYRLQCKPGMTGSGVSSTITVTGTGGSAAPKVTREVRLVATDYTVTGVPTDVTSGETIRFELRNNGTEAHEFEVLGPDGDPVGEVPGTEPGRTGSATITFARTGAYTWQCLLKNPAGMTHKSLGMTGTITIGAAAQP